MGTIKLNRNYLIILDPDAELWMTEKRAQDKIVTKLVNVYKNRAKKIIAFL